MSRRVAARWMVAYLLVLFVLTLGTPHKVRENRNFVPFWMMEHDIRAGGMVFLFNFVGNLAIFVPLGWLLPSLLGRRWLLARVVGLSCAVSLFIEIGQGISGWRVADVDDVILNTLGGLLGYGLRVVTDRAWASWRRGEPRASQSPGSG